MYAALWRWKHHVPINTGLAARPLREKEVFVLMTYFLICNVMQRYLGDYLEIALI